VVNRFESGNTIHKTLTTSVVSAGIDGVVAIVALAAMGFYNAFLTAIVVAASLAYGLVRIRWYNTARNPLAPSSRSQKYRGYFAKRCAHRDH
jgi:ATP-binding cassette, subfamily B, bacterial CvaB/MchF/RaxB